MSMTIDRNIVNLSVEIQKAISLLGLSDDAIKKIEVVGCIAVKFVNGTITARKLFPDLPDSLPNDWTPVRGISGPDHSDNDGSFIITLSRYNYATGDAIPQDQIFSTLVHELIHVDQYRHNFGLYRTDMTSEMDANSRAIAYLSRYTSYPTQAYDFMIDDSYTGDTQQYIKDIANVIYPTAESGLDLISDIAEVDVLGEIHNMS